MSSFASRRVIRALGLIVLGSAFAACGFELDAGVGDEAPDGSLPPSSSTSSGSAGGSTSGNPSTSSSSTGGPGVASSGGSTGSLPIDDAGSDADATTPPLDDGGPDAPPPLVCSPRSVTGRFCDPANPVTCQDVRNASNFEAVFEPSGQAIGQTYFTEPFQTAPFTFDVGTKYYRANGSGVLAVFLGGNPATQGDLCARLDALAEGEAAIVFWRQGTNDFRVKVLTDCGGSPWAPSVPSSDADGFVHVVYDGAKLTVTAKGGTSQPSTEQAIQLAPSVRLGVVTEAANESFLVDHMTVTCP